MNVLADFLNLINASFNGNAYLVGGCVRDSFLGAESKDIDIEIYNYSYDEICAEIREYSLVSQIFECGKSFHVIKARLVDGQEIDISVPRREISTGTGHKDYVVVADPFMSTREASYRRDFTFNAMMKSVSGDLVDHYNGLADLREKCLRAVGNSFLDDPLRVLRAMQFCGRFELRVEEQTAYLCALISGQVLNMSRERIWGEWEKLLTKCEKPSLGIQFLKDTGTIVLFPELYALDGLPQDAFYHPEGCALTHTQQVLDQGARLAKENNLDPHQRIVLMLSCLCHDLGKPETTVHEDGRIKSPGHAQFGEEVTRTFLTSLGVPISLHDAVVTLCYHHMDLVGGKLSSRFIRRLANKVNRFASLDLLKLLIVADHMGRGNASKHPVVVDEMMSIATNLNVQSDVPEPIFQGRNLIQMGFKPGPLFKTILSDLFEKQLDGEIQTIGEATEYVNQKYK